MERRPLLLLIFPTRRRSQFPFFLLKSTFDSEGKPLCVPLTKYEHASIKPLRLKLLVLLKQEILLHNFATGWIIFHIFPLSLRDNIFFEYSGTPADPGRWREQPSSFGLVEWLTTYYISNKVKSLDFGGIPPFLVPLHCWGEIFNLLLFWTLKLWFSIYNILKFLFEP
jgi:hypothetical protein